MSAKSKTKPAKKTQQRSLSSNASYKFDRGFPTKGAAQRARDDAYYQRALTAYRFWYPTVSLEGVFNGYRDAHHSLSHATASKWRQGPSK